MYKALLFVGLLAGLIVACASPAVEESAEDDVVTSKKNKSEPGTLVKPGADSGAPGTACTEGAVQSCVASGGAAGVQTCERVASNEIATTGWSECIAGGDAATGGNGGNGGNGGSGGSSGADGGTGSGGTGTGGTPPQTTPCTGVGRIFKTLGDDCIHDNGRSDSGDQLEIYCINNIARFCLSHEQCPWRSGGTTPDTVTCSRAGIPAGETYFAKARESCGKWQGHERYCCSTSSVASFSGC